MTMDARKNRVLQAIVDDYVNTAEPVGSRTIARKYRLGVSPATIRNEMADLEELGYIEQPHTSAGRVPSDLGYRYYVDCLMDSPDLAGPEREQIQRAFERKLREMDALIRDGARILSESTRLTGVITGPQMGRSTFREIRLVPVTRDRALLVYITDTGFMENTILDMPVEVTLLELQQISTLLSEHLKGLQVERLSHGALQELERELERYGSLLEQSLTFLAESIRPGERQRVYLGGATHLLSQPEFRDIEKARNLFRVLEHEDLVGDLLDQAPGEARIGVQIGEEIKVRELADCSLISAAYQVGDKLVGRIGVIGPKRMEYAKVIAIVDDVTQRMSEAIRRNLLAD